ncbi:hypothetical protein BT96DRAFT_1018627 [Gymnopus androsaceus JB14]|uniref:Uncharacterized protein n=1 Tax=Gymnopus androsaceus JB14 TaxID=1447944 RepID=A0A6A4HS67_9AGAR|nr:hypothetical protein BT96DRAFT_1018627 [Gymnopus androsaceus JB14]
MAQSSQSNFNPLEHREWQSLADRRLHEASLMPLKCGWRSYPEAHEKFRRVVENLQIAVERTDLLYHSHKYSSFIKNYEFQKSYHEYKICLQHLKEESRTFAGSCDEYEREHPELFPPRHKLPSKRRASVESRRCQVDITVGESSIDIKVQGEGSVNVRMKQEHGHSVPPPPYILNPYSG